MTNFSKKKRMIVLGCLVSLLSLPASLHAVPDEETKTPSSLFERTQTKVPQSESQSNQNKEEQNTRRGLFAPPPDGGEAVGEEAPVNGQEIIFFLLAVSGFTGYKLLSQKRSCQ